MQLTETTPDLSAFAARSARPISRLQIDPDSPYHKDVFDGDKEFVFYCNGAWRSALAADVAQQMGLEHVVEMDGGFAEWKKRGYPIAERPTRR